MHLALAGLIVRARGTGCLLGLAMVLLAGAAVLQSACAQPRAARDEAAACEAILEEDPSIRMSFLSGGPFVSNPQLAERVGAVSCFEHVGEPSSRVVMTFEPGSDLRIGIDEYCVEANAAFAEVVTDRRIEPLAMEASDAGGIEGAGLPWRAFTFVTDTGRPGASSICDAGAIRFATPGGFWTISWNSDLGGVGDTVPVMREFLGRLRIDREGD